MIDCNKLGELLLTVQKPGRYVGGEWNAVKKEWAADRVKVCLAFPDVYEVGMSYLGIKILYGILNLRPDCLAERVFAPWGDFESVMRANGIPLFSLESRRALRDFDIVGFSLAYELTYTNTLNMLDMGGIPVRAAEREEGDPVVIAGGPSCFNPEPMAEFIDAFLIGDGEEAISDIIEVYKNEKLKMKNARARLLTELAKIPGVYVPSLYRKDGASAVVRKRCIESLEGAYYPSDQIVPNIGIVHDRIAIEVMRGCVHACRFCQASSCYRPCRERSGEKVIEIARRSYAATGYDEISLLSLSSVDYPHLKSAIEGLTAEFCGRAVSVSVPSLRIEEVAKEIPLLISKVKKAGLTFAPEAGSERLRRSIGKNIDIERLFEAVGESFRAGWKRVKLYFMIGLPGETDEDIAAIAGIALKISELKRAFDRKPATVTLSVNAFVPKPHTPLEREAMDSRAELDRKKALLRKSIRSGYVDLDVHSFDMSYLEGIFSRGDRRLSEVIRGAWRSGARFDAWQEHFNFGLWMASFEAAGVDPDFYVSRRRPAGEALPWGFIDTSPALKDKAQI